MQAQRAEASYRLTFRNGSGYDVLHAKRANRHDGVLVVVDLDGVQHTFSSGADWHLKSIEGDR